MSEMEQKTVDVGGATVTINASPSELIVKAASAEVIVTDTLGRSILLKKPNPLANLDFAKAAGSEKFNVLYLSEVSHLKFVAAIDDSPVPTPSTDGELRALYKRLGDEGNEAAQLGVAKNFYGIKDALDKEAELKNS